MKKLIIIISIILVSLNGCRNSGKSDQTAGELLPVAEDVPDVEDGPHLFCCYMEQKQLPDGDFFDDAVDIYNSSIVYNALMSVFDVWQRYEDKEFALKSLESARTDMIRDVRIRMILDECINDQKAFYSTQEYDNSLCGMAYNSLWEADSLICERFHVNNYVDLDVDAYWKSLSVTDEIEYFKREYDEISPDTDLEGIHDYLASFDSFEERARWTWAYVNYAKMHRASYRDVHQLLAGTYSPIQYFLWRFWRADLQLSEYGPSTWSPIPNYVYNAKRLELAELALTHIVRHPDDEVAINQFLVLSHHPNVHRAGEFPFGNEASTEMIYLGLSPSSDK